MSNKELLLGAHMSVAGGLEKAIEQGELIECTAIQIFTKSNRQWRAKNITDSEASTFRTAWSKSPIKTVMVHAAYLINIGSPNKEVEKKSVDALEIELMRCVQLGIPYLVIHPGGSSQADSLESCLEQIARNIDSVLDSLQEKLQKQKLQEPTPVTLLLEIMAGQGGAACYRFEHLASIINNSRHKKNLGACFDTCHAFAAGYDFRDKDSYKAMWQEFDSLIGMDKLKAIHLNDSKKELGSRVDRHENIGEGKIGLAAFKLLMNDARLAHVPKILETPRATLDDYKHNMAVLKKLLD
jgi:deoxyribonuclease-4